MSNIGNIIHHQFILIYFDFLTFSVILNTTSQMHKQQMHAGGETHLNCWCSLELRILEENLSASFSKLREYSSSISALRRKNSCRSCSSWIRDSDCCSKHLNCSTSWLRISVHQKTRQKWYDSTVYAAVTTVHNMPWSEISWKGQALHFYSVLHHYCCSRAFFPTNLSFTYSYKHINNVGWLLHWPKFINS